MCVCVAVCNVHVDTCEFMTVQMLRLMQTCIVGVLVCRCKHIRVLAYVCVKAGMGKTKDNEGLGAWEQP